MEDDFVTFEQATKLKELGFDWNCNHYYDASEQINECVDSNVSNYDNFNGNCFIEGVISAPLLSQAQKWLRDNHNIDICIVRSGIFNKSYYYEIIIDCDFNNMIQGNSLPNISYEESLSESIDKALEILKERI